MEPTVRSPGYATVFVPDTTSADSETPGPPMSPPTARKAPVKARTPAGRRLVGWREWLALPELGVERIKAKVDTGARSSALHAFDLESFERDGAPWVRFTMHPIQRQSRTAVVAEAPRLDERWVRSSSGKRTLRPVIMTPVTLGESTFPIELTLVRRDMMGFRMLLGRQAVRPLFLVDPGRSYLGGRSLFPKTKPS